MRWRRCVSAWLLGLAATGCVTRAEHEAAISRIRALEHQRAQREERLAQLDSDHADLAGECSRLEVERASLEREKQSLLAEIGDLRAAQQRAARASEAERERLAESYRRLLDDLDREVAEGTLEIHRLRGHLQLRLLDRILFASGNAALRPEGAAVIGRLARQLAKLEGHAIRVEGHTDDVAIESQRFPSNWELSVARAAGVVRALEQGGVPPDRLVAQGFGSYHPIASNADAEGRARNRRIEIVLVPETGPDSGE